MSKWIFVSASLGDSSMELAGTRIGEQAKAMGLFDEVKVYFTKDLESCAPKTFSKYREFLNREHKGFGYFAWKPELIETALEAFPNAQGVYWADAGCEIFTTPWNRLTMRYLLRGAEKKGYWFYSLNMPEYEYSKIDLIRMLNSSEEDVRTPQIQATTFALCGVTGRRILKAWLENSLKDT